MAERVDRLPESRSKGGKISPFRALFRQVSDGQPWVIRPHEMLGLDAKHMRLRLNTWGRDHNRSVSTRQGEDGSVFVQMFLKEDGSERSGPLLASVQESGRDPQAAE